MTKILTLLIVTLALTGCYNVPKQTPPAVNPPIVKEVSPYQYAYEHTVILMRKTVAGWEDSICAAAYVGPDTILTAHHCVVPAVLPEKEADKYDDGELDPDVILDQPLRFVLHFDWSDKDGTDKSLQMPGYVRAYDMNSD